MTFALVVVGCSLLFFARLCSGWHDLPVVLVMGTKLPTAGGRTIEFLNNPWKVNPQIVFMTNELELHRVLRRWVPDCLVSFAAAPAPGSIKGVGGTISKSSSKSTNRGDFHPFPLMQKLPFWLRERWLHYEVDPADLDDQSKTWWRGLSWSIQETMFETWLGHSLSPDGTRPVSNPAHPLVSVFTPTYHGGDKLWRVFWSLRNQTYDNWEWVVIIDDPTDLETVVQLAKMAPIDCRLHYWLPDTASGVIGLRKRQAAMLSRGDLLVEMDHDDALLPHALSGVVASFAMDPERIGFVYTDFSEPVWGSNLTRFGNYGKTFPLHFMAREYGNEYLATKTRPLLERSLYHLACLPNHVRVWNATVYRALNGHAPLIVGDDYELLMRTYLATRSMYYDRLSYLQYRNPPAAADTSRPAQVGAATNAQGKLPWDNFTFRRNRLIQWIVANVYQRYWPRLHERARALGPGHQHLQYGWRDELGNVTVVLPVVSPTDNIWPAIRALRQQTYKNWRLLILTNGFPCNSTQLSSTVPLRWTPVTVNDIDAYSRVRKRLSEWEWVVVPGDTNQAAQTDPPKEVVFGKSKLSPRKPSLVTVSSADADHYQFHCLSMPSTALPTINVETKNSAKGRSEARPAATEQADHMMSPGGIVARGGQNSSVSAHFVRELALRERGTELAHTHWIAHLSANSVWEPDHLTRAIASLQPAGEYAVDQFKFLYSSIEACHPTKPSLDYVVASRALHWSPQWRTLTHSNAFDAMLRDSTIAKLVAQADRCRVHPAVKSPQATGGAPSTSPKSRPIDGDDETDTSDDDQPHANDDIEPQRAVGAPDINVIPQGRGPVDGADSQDASMTPCLSLIDKLSSMSPPWLGNKCTQALVIVVWTVLNAVWSAILVCRCCFRNWPPRELKVRPDKVV